MKRSPKVTQTKSKNKKIFERMSRTVRFFVGAVRARRYKRAPPLVPVEADALWRPIFAARPSRQLRFEK